MDYVYSACCLDTEWAPCGICKSPHHQLLHREKTEQPKVATSNPPHPVKPSTSKPASSLSVTSDRSNAVLLPTAVIKVEVPVRNGKRMVLARALLDSGSEINIISEHFIRKNKIRIRRRDTAISLSGITNGAVSINFSAQVKIESRFSDFSLFVDAEVVPLIPLVVRENEINSVIAANPNINFAEANLASSRVDLIIGSEYYETVMLEKRYNIEKVFIRETRFGSVVSGPCFVSEDRSERTCGLTTHSVDLLLQKFWTVEDVPSAHLASTEQNTCADFVAKTIRRNNQGRFVVRLPFKSDNLDIGESRARAVAALKRVEKKSTPELRKAYVEFMEEYSELQHMSKIEKGEICRSPCYYIPHRAVLRPESSTTKLRVVFNASAKTTSNVSLNEILMLGPSIQPELISVLLRFRTHRIAFSADISKMYRQVLVDPRDTDFQRIVWRSNPTGPIEDFRLNTVTYGTTPASYLVTYCLSVISAEAESSEPKASRAIREDFYVDDLLTGAESVDEAIELRERIHHWLGTANFELRKYQSNSQRLLKSIDSHLVEKLKNASVEIRDAEVISVLGLIWNPAKDCFSVKLHINDFRDHSVITKRSILSEIARVFDPLGILAPVLVRAKIILQDLWREQLSWDDPIPEPLAKKFKEYCSELSALNAFSLPRCYSNLKNVVLKQLVGFSDSSEKAYAAVVYFRTVDSFGRVQNRFVCAKTRVAPVKTLTIPKLELQAALLLSELMDRIARELTIEPENVFLFSDSTVVLHWLRGSADRWTVFVRNRVLRIKAFVVSRNWNYVRTHQNPADLATRGITVEAFLKNDLWTQGPSFLFDSDPFRTIEIPGIAIGNLPEQRKAVAFGGVAVCDFSIINRYSSLRKLVNVIAYVLRFIRKCKRVEDSSNVYAVSLSASERSIALNTIARMVQQNTFRKEIDSLKSTGSVNNRSSLSALCPFFDATDVIRVGGRLKRSSLAYERKHPIVLPASSNLVELLVRSIHMKYFHANKSFVATHLMQSFWFVGGINNVIKRVIRACTVCTRYVAQSVKQLMGQLPEPRVTVSRPFTVTGVDFAGPFLCKCVAHRSVKFHKIYLSVFVCFSTKAVHLEIVSDLSSEAFVNALHRFIARRGVPKQMYSDNGTNFVGASKRLVVQSSSLENFASERGIRWTFIPPRAPHQGGLWEAAVRSAKYFLQRATKGQALNFEEYSTMFTRIEAILNSRPLCIRSISNDASEVLTPGHFLIGDSLLSSNSMEVSAEMPLSRRYELIRNQVNGFWKLWSKDYLNQLQIRNKWRTLQKNLAIGDIVVVKEDNLPPQLWKMGRVIQVYPDVEGQVRVVDLKLDGTVKRRNVAKLVILLPEKSYNSSGGEKC